LGGFDEAETGGGVSPRRPLLRYHGGKWRLAPWIIGHMPRHRIYVEPFAGAGSVLLRKARSYGEILNDLDEDVVNLYRVLRDGAPDLQRRISLTPYSRQEFSNCFKVTDDPIERARRTLVRYWFGFGAGAARTPGSTGFRNTAKRQGSTPAHDWMGFPDALGQIIDRLRGVVIDSEDAVACIERHDTEATLYYVDPPYIHSTRSGICGPNGRRAVYVHEMTEDDHSRLLTALQSVKGMVLLSGYRHQIYDDALPTWRRVEMATHGDGAVPRTECLWINPAADAATRGQQTIAGVA
jgi:DNA adenine methylase